jgi:hypothetical protein
MVNPGTRTILDQQQKRFVAEWRDLLATFRDYQVSPPENRVNLLGDLFEKCSPWIERGVRSTSMRHFLLLPTEMLVARLFARVAHRDDLPDHHGAFLMWIEGNILTDLADPSDDLGVCNGAPGEPPAELQQKFNNLPFSDRALFYLYMVEDFDAAALADKTGMPKPKLSQALQQVWRQLEKESEGPLPGQWKPPGA